MNEIKKHWHLYILKLEQGKYYVGITTKFPEERYREHARNIRAAGWTRLHKPLRLFDKQDLGFATKEFAEKRENLITLKYMKKYGINNVRGGKYCDTEDYVVEGRKFYRRDVWNFRQTAVAVVVVLMAMLCFVSIALIEALRS